MCTPHWLFWDNQSILAISDEQRIVRRDEDKPGSKVQEKLKGVGEMAIRFILENMWDDAIGGAGR